LTSEQERHYSPLRAPAIGLKTHWAGAMHPKHSHKPTAFFWIVVTE